MPRLVTSELAAAEAFYDDALRRGHEGVMVKSLGAPYEAGRRAPSGGNMQIARFLRNVMLGRPPQPLLDIRTVLHS